MSAVFVPTVVAIAIAAFGVWLVWGPDPALVFAVAAAVSAPDHRLPLRVGLATPISITTAAGRGAQAGVLIKDAEALERMAAVDTLIVDKTGTLTEGRPKLTDVLVFGAVTEGDLLAVAAALERGSEHPLAEAIVDGAAARGTEVHEAADFDVYGRAFAKSGQTAALGNAAMMAELGLDTTDAEASADRLRSDGKTAMFVAIDGRLAGIVAVADPIKATTAEAIRSLHELGLRVIMATGDNRTTAEAVAARLGIDEVRAGVLPEDKKILIDTLRNEGAVVAMAGDGVNDAPALAAADVGISMGARGSAAAAEMANAILLVDDLERLAEAAEKLPAGAGHRPAERLCRARPVDRGDDRGGLRLSAGGSRRAAAGGDRRRRHPQCAAGLALGFSRRALSW